MVDSTLVAAEMRRVIVAGTTPWAIGFQYMGAISPGIFWCPILPASRTGGDASFSLGKVMAIGVKP